MWQWFWLLLVFICSILSSGSHDHLPGRSLLLLCAQLPWQPACTAAIEQGCWIFASFHGISLPSKPTALRFLLSFFLGLLPSMFAASARVLQVCGVVIVPISWAAITLFKTNKAPCKRESILRQKRPFQVIKPPFAQKHTVRSLAKIGQLKCESCVHV